MRSAVPSRDYKKPEAPNLAYRFRQASQIIAFLVAALGLLVLCGWVFKVPVLTFIQPNLQSMKVNTALSFLCLGAGLWLAHNDERQRTRRILGLLVVIVAGLTLTEYAFHVDLGIDQLLFRDTRSPSLSAYPGRMAIATAICFLFLGSAVSFLGPKKTLTLQRTLVGACFAFSLVALCGYLYGVKPFYSITSYSTIGLHTAIGFFAACIAYLLARPDEGIVSAAESESSGGFLLRRLVPAIIIVPILIGWLGLVGQRADLYDTPFGVVLQALGSIGCLTALILLIGRSMHRLELEHFRAEHAVRESEQRFRLVADTAPALIWMSGTDKLCTYFNKSWLDFTGHSLEEELGNGRKCVHPDDFQRCLDTYRQAFDRREVFQMEYRLRRRDGEYRWILDNGVPRYSEDRSFVGYIGSCIDVTELKHADEALSGVSRKLVEAQEQERTRIARELHDDTNQRLALLAIALSQLRGRNDLPFEVRDELQELQRMTSDISDGVHDLSHELHFSPLEFLGLVKGMTNWCREYGLRQKLEIDFKSHHVPNLPRETSICLFRVLQEALHNAAKYSGVKRIEVQMAEKSGEIHLIVNDAGKGFDIEAAKRKSGLGLTSMQERVRLVGGTIVIDAKPSAGTTIHVRIPLELEREAQRAAG